MEKWVTQLSFMEQKKNRWVLLGDQSRGTVSKVTTDTLR